jgi:hypothetical protein
MELIRITKAEQAPPHLQLAAKAALAIKGVELSTYTVRDETTLYVKLPNDDARLFFCPEFRVADVMRMMDAARNNGLIGHDGMVLFRVVVNAGQVRAFIDYDAKQSYVFGASMHKNAQLAFCYAVTAALAQHYVAAQAKA